MGLLQVRDAVVRTYRDVIRNHTLQMAAALQRLGWLVAAWRGARLFDQRKHPAGPALLTIDRTKGTSEGEAMEELFATNLAAPCFSTVPQVAKSR
jgi:hypothetical protein